MWSVIEVEVGIICVCMPSLRLGITHLFIKIMGSAHRPTPAVGNGEFDNDDTPLSDWTTSNTTFQTSVPVIGRKDTDK